MVPVGEQRALEASLHNPYSRAVTFPGAGHVQSYLVAPRRYEAVVASFLAAGGLCGAVCKFARA